MLTEADETRVRSHNFSNYWEYCWKSYEVEQNGIIDSVKETNESTNHRPLPGPARSLTLLSIKSVTAIGAVRELVTYVSSTLLAGNVGQIKQTGLS